METETKRKIIKKYLFLSFLIVTIAVAILLMLIYNEKGETNMPFQIEKIIIQSSLDAQSRKSDKLWDLSLSQNNDIFITIQSSKNNKEDIKIKKISIERMATINKKELGNIKILLPTSNDVKKIFEESKDDYSGKIIDYQATQVDDISKQEICRDGGMIALRISNQEIGEYISNEGTEIKYNSSLLEKAKINEEDLKFTLQMDLLIETTDNNKYKGTIELELPVNNFKESGKVDKEITDFSNVIFKRSE